jgi:hypothetical protein
MTWPTGSPTVQLTTDGRAAYLIGVESGFGSDVDHAMLVKIYGNAPQGPQTRYSPAECIGAEPKPIMGSPDPKHISTSYVERSNLSIRMGASPAWPMRPPRRSTTTSSC